jgi:predicted dehydrogenase
MKREVRSLIKTGVIGLGHSGLLHLRNARFIKNVKVTAVADKSEKALSNAKVMGVKHVYKDYQDLLRNEELDATIIALPTFLHKESVVSAAENGLDVFVEKPLARNVEECLRISQAVERNDVRLAVGHNYRYFDHVRKLKMELEKGTIGDVEVANLEHYVNGPFAHPLEPVPIQDWWLDRKLVGGGVLIDQGSHLIDLFSWFFPKPKLLYSNLGYRYGLEMEDSAILLLESQETSTRGLISVGWFQKMVFPQFNFRINLQGTARYLSTEDFAPKNLYLHAGKAAIKNVLLKFAGRSIHPLSYTYYYASYFEELRQFFKCVEADTDEVSYPSVKDGLEAIRIIEESYKANGIGQA